MISRHHNQNRHGFLRCPQRNKNVAVSYFVQSRFGDLEAKITFSILVESCAFCRAGPSAELDFTPGRSFIFQPISNDAGE